MKVGVIGAGHIGGTLAQLMVEAEHEVMLANSRGPATLRGFIERLGGKAHAGTVQDVARFGELVIVSMPFKEYPRLSPDLFVGRIVVDTMNYYPDRDGHFAELDSGRVTSSELVQKHLAGARVVKAFNAIRWDVLGSEGKPQGVPGRLAIPISGDDRAAKDLVVRLIDSIGFDCVDAGSLAEGGRRHQVGTPVYTVPLSMPELSRRLQEAR